MAWACQQGWIVNQDGRIFRLKAESTVEIAPGLVAVAVVELKLAGNKIRCRAQLGISLAFKFGKSVGINLAILNDHLGKVALVRQAVGRGETDQGSCTLGATGAGGRGAGCDAASLHSFHRTLGNGISVVADIVFVAGAIFPDVIGEDRAAVL